MLDKQLIHYFLDTFEITNYLINDDLTVDVNGHVNISNKELHSLPFKLFKKQFNKHA